VAALLRLVKQKAAVGRNFVAELMFEEKDVEGGTQQPSSTGPLAEARSPVRRQRGR
jgi:hypothetical protein